MIASQRTRPAAVRFDEWLKKAKRGDSNTYYIGGNLASARVYAPEVDDLASRVWSAFKRGEVLLTQRRRHGTILGSSSFNYIATRTGKRTDVR